MNQHPIPPVEDDEEPTDEEILAGLRRSMAQVLAGNFRPAHEVLDEIEREPTDTDLEKAQ